MPWSGGGLGQQLLFLPWGPRRPLFRMLLWEALLLVWAEEEWLQSDQSAGVYWGPLCTQGGLWHKGVIN